MARGHTTPKLLILNGDRLLFEASTVGIPHFLIMTTFRRICVKGEPLLVDAYHVRDWFLKEVEFAEKHGHTQDTETCRINAEECQRIIDDFEAWQRVEQWLVPDLSERRTVREATSEGQISLSTRFDILKRDAYRCQICGRDARDGVKLEVDHKIPKSKSGTNDPENLWTLCFDCNRGKSDKLL